MRVTVKYHIPRAQVDGGTQHCVTVIERVPGRWDRPNFAIVDEILIDDRGVGDPLTLPYEDRLRKSGFL